MTQSRGIRRSTAWRSVPRMNEDDVWAQRALADVIRERRGLMDRSAASIYRAIGISSTSWQNYFKAVDREVPYWVLREIARELNLTTGQLVARAELREAELREAERPATFGQYVVSQLPPEHQETAAKAAAIVAERTRKAETNGS